MASYPYGNETPLTSGVNAITAALAGETATYPYGNETPLTAGVNAVLAALAGEEASYPYGNETALTAGFNAVIDAIAAGGGGGGGGFDWSQLKNGIKLNSVSGDLDLSGMDVGSWETLRDMFNGASIHELTGISNWNTSNVTNMYCTFYGNSHQSFNPDVSRWNTSKVTSMMSTFQGCSGAAFNPDVSMWDTSSVTHMGSIFNGCSGAAFNPDVSKWNTTNVISFSYMFARCTKLKSLNLANINTGKATAMAGMFNMCSALEAVIWAINSTTVQPLVASPDGYFAPSNVIFYVPDALVADYKAATNWATIADRIKGVSELPTTYKTLYGIE